MHTEPVHHHKNRHVAERVEGLVGVIMVIAAAILLVGLAWGLMQSGSTEPTWMR